MLEPGPTYTESFPAHCAVQGILGGAASAWSPVDLTAVLAAHKGLPGFRARLGQSCLFLLILLQSVIA